MKKTPRNKQSKTYKNLKDKTLCLSPTFAIEKSQITKKFIVVMKCGDQKWTISPHYKIEGAEHGVEMCKKCLATFSKDDLKQPLKKWFLIFIARINSYFNYDDDDEILGVGHFIGGILFVDSRKSIIDEHTALINIESINRTGKRLFN
jgi:hypothetical protein